MAYPTVSAPYGFKPINRFDGMPYAGATQLYPVTSGQAVYNGQVVQFVNGGTISPVSDIHGTVNMVGVCVGVQYVNSSGQTVQDRKSTRLNSSHSQQSRMPSSA